MVAQILMFVPVYLTGRSRTIWHLPLARISSNFTPETAPCLSNADGYPVHAFVTNGSKGAMNIIWAMYGLP